MGPLVSVRAMDDWRCTLVEGGELSVMMGLDRMRPTRLVANWDYSTQTATAVWMIQGLRAPPARLNLM